LFHHGRFNQKPVGTPIKSTAVDSTAVDSTAVDSTEKGMGPRIDSTAV